MLEEVLILDVLPSAEYSFTQKKFCGFEWEAKAIVKNSLLHITLWCNRNMEGSLWSCTARIMVRTAGNNGLHDFLRKVSFSKANRFLNIEVTKGEQCLNEIEIRLELLDILGCRDVAMYQVDFTKTSLNSNICFLFDKSDVRLYSNKEYLGVHSDKMRHIFSQSYKGVGATPNISSRMSDFGDDFDVLSVHSDAGANTEESIEEDVLEYHGIRSLNKASIPSSDNAGLEHIMLEGVEPDDFLVLLSAIYPPFAGITKESVKKLLAIAYQFGVEHIVWKCEQYFLNEDGEHSLDRFESLELAMSYKMAALEDKCLKSMTTAADVRNLLDDPRLVCAPQEMRSILLETLLHRLKSDSDVRESHIRRAAATSDAQDLVCRLFQSVGLTGKKLPTYVSNKTTNIAENTFFINNKKPVQEKAWPTVSAEVASSKKEVGKQEGIRKNLEFSLKCYREFIRDAEEKVAAVAEANISASLDEIGLEVKPHSSSAEKPVPPPRRGKRLRAENQDLDFLKNLVFDTFNACELSKDRIIIVGCTRALSPHDVFADLVLPPYTLMKNVLYSFVTHIFTKIYGDTIVNVVRLHFCREVDAFPHSLSEHVADAIIAGYELRKQLGNDDLLVHELRVYFVKQLRENFGEFVENIRAGYFANSFS